MKIIVFFLFLSCFVQGADLQSIRFKTATVKSEVVATKEMGKLRKEILSSKQHFPEGIAIVGSLILGREKFKLSKEQQETLTKDFSQIYATIAKDPLFKNIHSVLPEALPGMQESQEGHYFLYTPDKMDSRTPVIIFLHGFGGNFQFYTWVLKKHFPNHIIMVPSNGISWGNGKTKMISDMLTDARERLKIKLSKPWLMAISAGGPAGFRIYNENPEKYKGYISIASAPRKEIIFQLKPQLNILMLNGTKDKRFPLEKVKQRVRGLENQIPNFEFKEITSDHFFLLTNQETAFNIFKDFMNK